MSVSVTNSAGASAPLSVGKSVGLESVGFGAAEIGSIAVNLGVVAVLDQLIPKEIMHYAAKAVAKTCIEPFQDTIEKYLSSVKLEEFHVDKSKDKEQRAEDYAKALIVFGTAWFAAISVKTPFRRVANKHLLGVEPPNAPKDNSLIEWIKHHIPFVNWTGEEKMIFLADEGVHYGSILLMGLNQGVAKFTDDQVKNIAGLLEKVGVPHDKAKQLASYAAIYELPNVLGTVSGIGAIFGKHAYGWPDKHVHQTLADIVTGRATSSHSVSLA